MKSIDGPCLDSKMEFQRFPNLNTENAKLYV